jgi:hypothetical protein
LGRANRREIKNIIPDGAALEGEKVRASHSKAKIFIKA